MIDVKKTIFNNILDKLNKLRFQAKDDSSGFKSLLSIIVFDDLIEWAKYNNEEANTIKRLVDKRDSLVLNNCCITPCYSDTSTAYTNVNTPQTNDTWKRVLDNTPSWTKYTPITHIELIDIIQQQESLIPITHIELINLI